MRRGAKKPQATRAMPANLAIKRDRAGHLPPL